MSPAAVVARLTVAGIITTALETFLVAAASTGDSAMVAVLSVETLARANLAPEQELL